MATKSAEDDEMEKMAAKVAAWQRRKAAERVGESGANRQGELDPEIKRRKDEGDDDYEKRLRSLKHLRKSADETDDDMVKRLKAAAMTEDSPPPRNPPGESAFGNEPPKDDEAAEEAPLGSQVLGGIHDHLKDMSEQLEAASKPLENPAVKDYVNTLKDAIDGHLEEAKSIHKEQYPDHPELGADEEKAETATSDDDNPNNTPPSGTMVKFLAGARTHRLALKGLASNLDRLALSKAVNRRGRQELEAYSRGVRRILKAAESYKPQATGTLPADVVPKAQYDALVKNYDQLESRFERLVDKLSQMVPANV